MGKEYFYDKKPIKCLCTQTLVSKQSLVDRQLLAHNGQLRRLNSIKKCIFAVN